MIFPAGPRFKGMGSEAYLVTTIYNIKNRM
jgi:hypothetical protein